MKETLKELREEIGEIDRLGTELLITIEDVELKLTRVYRIKTKKEEREATWKVTKKLEDILADLNILFEIRAKTLLGGYWARYHYLKKFCPDNKEAIADLAKRVDDYFEGVDSEEYPELFVAWGHLFATVMGELKGDSDTREQVNKVIYPLAVKKGLIKPIAEAVESRVLEAITGKDFQGAIKIADEFRQELLDEAIADPKARLNAANILNGCGLARINLSDMKKGEESVELLREAIITDFWEAEKTYERIDPPNLDHFNGLINRLILTTIKILEVYSEEKPDLKDISGQIQSEFSSTNRLQALKLIAEAIKRYSDDIKILITVETFLTKINRFLERH